MLFWKNLHICPVNETKDTIPPTPHIFKNNSLEGLPEALAGIVKKAYGYAQSMGDKYVGTEHLLLGILDDEEVQKAILPATPEDVKEEVDRLLGRKKTTIEKIREIIESSFNKEEKYNQIEKLIKHET